MYQNPIYGILNLFDQHSLTALDKDRLKIKSLHVYIDFFCELFTERGLVVFLCPHTADSTIRGSVLY